MTGKARRRLVIIWSGARDRVGLFLADEPKSKYWMLEDLSQAFDETTHVFPQETAAALRRAPSGVKTLFSVPAILKAGRGASMIYCYTIKAMIILAALKSVGLIKAPIFYYFAAQDVSFDVVRCDPWRRAYYHGLMGRCSAVQFTAEHERAAWAALFPDLMGRLHFLPRCMDFDFYRDIGRSARAAGRPPYFVAVGNDAKRDWGLIIALIGRGYPIKVLTQNPSVLSLFAAEAPDADVISSLSLEESARVIANSAGVVLATQPNARFSGSTTLAVAAALSQAIVLDEEQERDTYALVHGRNCLTFRRGNVDDAAVELDRLLAEPELRGVIGAALRRETPIPSTADAARKILEWMR